MREETTKIGAGIYYEKDDKAFLAAFYGQAVHNVYLVFCHIAKRLGETEPDDDGTLLGWYTSLLKKYGRDKKKTSVISKNRFYELVNDHFPFLHIIHSGEYKENAENKLIENAQQLIRLLEFLRDYRNLNSHKIYTGEQPADRTGLVRQLHHIYDANINKVKEEFWGSNVRRSLKEANEIELNFSHLRRFVKNEDKTLVHNGKPLKVKDNPTFRYKFLDSNSSELSIYGHLFFVSLFLEKKSAVLMQKQIKGLKDAREVYARMTSEVLCRSRISMPRIRFHSKRTADALVLDMLNELAKAPRPFYDQLTEEGRKKFQIDSSEKTDADDEFSETVVKAIRKENRFGYFAMRYLEEVNAFKALRFQIDLGNFHFHVYSASINGQQEPRHLVRRLFGFGKLNDYLPEKASEAWMEKRKDLDYYEKAEQPFITYTFPHYHLEENKIGIRFSNQPGNPRWPNLDVNTLQPYPKYQRHTEDKAEAFISVHELMPMAFCHYLYAKTEQRAFTEDLITAKLRNIRQLFAALKSGELVQKLEAITSSDPIAELLRVNYNLKPTEVPERLLFFLRSEQPKRSFNDDLEKFNTLIEETQKRLRWITATHSQTAAIGKPQHRTLRAGDCADWLVHDFMRFQPVAKRKLDDGTSENDLKSKANPKKYRLLQKSLAMYALEKDQLPGLFAACNLTLATNKHPFLDQVMKTQPADWLSFYTTYLNERERYLGKCLSEAKKSKSFRNYYHFLKIKTQSLSATNLYEGWDVQLMLPTGLFTEAIHNWFRELASPSLRDWYNNQSKAQTIEKLIEHYLHDVLNDTFQPFYCNLPLCYDAYRENNPSGLTLEQRVSLQQEKWEQHNFENKEYLKNHKGEYERILKLIEPIEEDKDDFSDASAVINRFSAAFGRDTISNLPKSKYPIKDAKKQFSTLKSALLDFYILKRNAVADYRAMLDTEKLVRRIKAEDGLNSLMIRHLMSECNVFAEQTDTPLRLQDILPMGETAETGLLDKVQRFEQELDFFASNRKGKIIPDEKLGSWVLYTDDTKIKKQGNFRKLVKDRRLNNLAQFLVPVSDSNLKHQINRKRIEQELDIYDRNRIQIIQLMHDLENALYTSNLFTLNAKGFQNFGEMLTEFQGQCPLEESVKNALVAIRNAVLHNQYPVAVDVSGIVLFDPLHSDVAEKSGLGIAAQLSDYATNLVTKAKAIIPSN